MLSRNYFCKKEVTTVGRHVPVHEIREGKRQIFSVQTNFIKWAEHVLNIANEKIFSIITP